MSRVLIRYTNHEYWETFTGLTCGDGSIPVDSVFDQWGYDVTHLIESYFEKTGSAYTWVGIKEPRDITSETNPPYTITLAATMMLHQKYLQHIEMKMGAQTGDYPKRIPIFTEEILELLKPYKLR